MEQYESTDLKKHLHVPQMNTLIESCCGFLQQITDNNLLLTANTNNNSTFLYFKNNHL